MSFIGFSGPEIRQAFFIVSPTVKGTYVCKECGANKQLLNLRMDALIMRDHRKHMSPYHLEMLLFLRCNSAMWNVQTVDIIIYC